MFLSEMQPFAQPEISDFLRTQVLGDLLGMWNFLKMKMDLQRCNWQKRGHFQPFNIHGQLSSVQNSSIIQGFPCWMIIIANILGSIIPQRIISQPAVNWSHCSRSESQKSNFEVFISVRPAHYHPTYKD